MQHPPKINTTNLNNGGASKKPRRVIGKYFLTKTLGNGSMGKVKLALNTDSKDTVAVKIVPRRQNAHPANKKERDAEIIREVRTIREASMMLLLDHPYIAKVYEMMLIDDYYYLFMEYVDGGQLLDYIISHGKLKERQARHISRQIASAIDYCHRNSIVHRDLKVENILISSTGTVKIIDFGLSNLFSPRSHLNTFCGSLYFAAPELLDGKAYTGPEVDVWSFGVVIFVLVCGQVPFDDATMQGMHNKVRQGHVEYPLYLSTDCKSLLQRMLVVSPQHRATMSEVISHDWMNKGYDAPIDNYLPKRKPLHLPIDMNVVRGMQGFEFGTEDEIKTQLETLISSEEYQKSAQELEQLSLHPYDVHSSNHILRRKSFSLAMTDPQSMPTAYHPLISIYYLVQERMQREGKSNPPQAIPTTVVTPVKSPSIGVAYTPEGKVDVHNPTEQEQDMMKSVLDASDVSPRVSSDSGPVTTCSEPIHVDRKESVFRRISRRLSRNHTPDNTQPPAISNTADRQKQPGEKSSKHKRATSITVRELPSTTQQREEIMKQDRRKSTANTGHAKKESISSRIVEIDDPAALLGLPPSPSDPFLHKSLTPQTQQLDDGHADDRVKSVYVKGLFSVSTTSSKKASEIRQEILRALVSDRNIKYNETRGRFQCISGDVRFDIYIVKIPWLLGMRGVQFRRLSGDPFVYKNTCSKILDNLKL